MIQVEEVRGPDVFARETATRSGDPRNTVRDRVHEALPNAEKLLARVAGFLREVRRFDLARPNELFELGRGGWHQSPLAVSA